MRLESKVARHLFICRVHVQTADDRIAKLQHELNVARENHEQLQELEEALRYELRVVQAHNARLREADNV